MTARQYEQEASVSSDNSGQTARFEPVSDEAAWERLLDQSEQAPVILFKHDPHCSISAAAHQQMEQVDANIALVDVSTQHALGRLIARQTGIRHESPQVLILRDRKPVWSASHWAIEAKAVRKAVAR